MKESKEEVPLSIDTDLKYPFDFEVHNSVTKQLVRGAQQKVVSEGQNWDEKYNLPKSSVLCKFSHDIYSNYKNPVVNDITPDSPWKLLYRAIGKVLKNSLDSFYGEFYFNETNHCLLLVIKGTDITSVGNWLSDIANVGLNYKGGVINSAFTFAEKVRQLICKFNSKPMLVITGHSLGGYLAQIITYILTYCYLDEDGKVFAREEPSDEFGIYTCVFDSPAAYEQIKSIDPKRDPIDFRRFMLPIVNYVKKVNFVNCNSKVGPHLGLMLVIEEFKQLEESKEVGLMDHVKNYFLDIPFVSVWSSHTIKNFEQIDSKNVQQIKHLESKNTAEYNPQEIQSCFFSPKNLERLQKFKILAPMCAQLVDQLPKFKVSNACIVVENASAEEFIARAYRMLTKFKRELDTGIFNGKQIFDMTIFELLKLNMVDDDVTFKLSKKWINLVQTWEHNTRVGGFESYEEMRFFGNLIHNSILKHFHLDYDKFEKMGEDQRNNFMATTEATLVLLVKENHEYKKQDRNMMKIIYLVLNGSSNVPDVTLDLSALDEKSKDQFENTNLDFLGNKATAINIFGKKLLKELRVWRIFSFQKDATLQDSFFYIDQRISKKKTGKLYKSANALALDLRRNKLKFVMISSDAGMGKSTALKQIAKTLQKELPHYWIVHLNLIVIQNELKNAKETLNSEEKAIQIVRNIVLSECKDETLNKVFDWKVEKKEMVLLFDSLDEICPDYRDIANSLIEWLHKTELQIVLTTRPHEGKDIKHAEVFELKLIREWKKKIEIIRKTFVSLEMKQPQDIEAWFHNIVEKNGYSGFWDKPMALVMAVTVYGSDLETNFVDSPDIFLDFIKKSMENTLREKMKLDEISASSKDIYDSATKKHNKLIEILAFCYIFNRGEVLKEFEKKVRENAKFINRFPVVKIDDKFTTISFLHKSYAEYLIATKFFPKKSTKIVELNTKQEETILFEKENCGIRKQMCGILAASPNEEIISVSGIVKGNEKKMLRQLIEEDCFELYLRLKDQLIVSSKLKETQSEKKESKNLLYLALEHSRREFILELIKDDAMFKDNLHQKDEQHKDEQEKNEHQKKVMHLAVRKHLYDQVKSHIEILIPFINKEDRYGLHPLHQAARNENANMAKLLIENGADVNCATINKWGQTPLYFAIKANRLKVVDLLKENGAELKYALRWALQQNRKFYLEIFKKIPIESQNECLTEALTYAAHLGDLEDCEFLCSQGAKPTKVNELGETSVHRAANEGSLDCLKYFLEDQETLDIRDQWGRTPLMYALLNNQEQVVDSLLVRNANVKAKDNNGRMCLHYAALGKNLTGVEMLLDFGADINSQDKDGCTALYHASEAVDEAVVKFLLEKEANPRIADNEGNTCLHKATQRLVYIEGEKNVLNCVKLLLEYEIPGDSQNLKQETPLHLAAVMGNIETVAYLLGEGAAPNLENVDGETCLHYAAKGIKGSLDIVKLLITNKADVTARNYKGETPADLAARRGKTNIADFLRGVVLFR